MPSSPHILGTNMRLGLVYQKLAGPWPCDQCKQTTQYAEMGADVNHIFCRNERCRFERIVDKKNHVIKESDGTVWAWNPVTGEKARIRTR